MKLYPLTLSSKRQVTMPIDLMRETGLQPGDTLCFLKGKGQLVLVPHMTRTAEQWAHLERELRALEVAVEDIQELKGAYSL